MAMKVILPTEKAPDYEEYAEITVSGCSVLRQDNSVNSTSFTHIWLEAIIAMTDYIHILSLPSFHSWVFILFRKQSHPTKTRELSRES